MATRAAGAEDRKIDIGRVLQNTFSTIGRHLLPFGALALLLSGAPLLAFGFLFPSAMPAGDPSVFLSPSFWAPVLVGFVLSAFLQAVIVRVVLAEAAGRVADIAQSIAEAIRLVPAIIGITLLSWLLIGLGFLFFVIPGVILFLMLAVAIPALVEEQRGVTGSMQRSRDLTRGSRWRILGIFAILLIVYWIAELAVGLVAINDGDPRDPGLLSLVLSAILNSAYTMLMAAMAACLYLELRTVKEGATSESLAAIFE